MEALHFWGWRNDAVNIGTAARFAAFVPGEREPHPMHQFIGILPILPPHRIVLVDTRTVGAERILAKTVGIPDEVEVGGRPPEDLSANARATVELAVGLPAVDEPGFEFQLVRREPLGTETGEEPRRVRRNVGRLIAPVVKAVVAVKADERHEDTGLRS